MLNIPFLHMFAQSSALRRMPGLSRQRLLSTGAEQVEQLLVGAGVALITALIALVAYLYRNQIAYDLQTITADVSGVGNSFSLERDQGLTRQLNARRVTFQNHGFRTLENVELHIRTRQKAQSIEIETPTTLSSQAIETVAEERVLRIKIPTFPPKEKISIIFLTVGWAEHSSSPVRGTGGKYKLIRKSVHGIIRRITVESILVAFIVFSTLIISHSGERSQSTDNGAHTNAPKPLPSKGP